ncbi:hypothetical protein [uncultured Treponema sp.]|uniref:hypothetical protein n=1 Tax=uncultured Treponema sp. TaxID=162155 RepID=UPI0025E2A3FD|nr:hypothetical protein [uncultured Treponema sp.]
MKKNKQFVKKLKARSKKNSLSEKMLGDNVFCLKNTIVKIEKERAYIKMKGDDPYVKPKKKFAKMQGDHPFTDMNGEYPAVDKK